MVGSKSDITVLLQWAMAYKHMAFRLALGYSGKYKDVEYLHSELHAGP